MVLALQGGPQLDCSSDGPEPADRCRFGKFFDHSDVACPAFQPLPFVAATSYGKPLGRHTACAHLQMGELSSNQYYPRCALGAQRDRLRWVAMIGPGRVALLRALQGDFETVCSGYRHRLVAAKHAVLADTGPGSPAARDRLAALIGDLQSDIDAFVAAHRARIEDAGLPAGALTRLAKRVLTEWQRNRRLDLPSVDEEWIQRPDPVSPSVDEEIVRAPSLLISRGLQPASVSLAGEIDHSNLDAVGSALAQATAGGGRVVVDLSGLTFCSVAGLRALVRAAESSDIELRGTPSHLARALDAARLTVDASEPCAQRRYEVVS